MLPSETIVARENIVFDTPIAFAEVDDRVVAPCTSCGKASSFDSTEQHVIRSSHCA